MIELSNKRIGELITSDCMNSSEVASAIKQALAEQRELNGWNGWVSVEDRLPEHGKLVLASYLNRLGNRRIICGHYLERYTAEADGELDQNDEYREEDDTFYLCEGWYEQQDNWGEYASIFVNEGMVDLWRPLPALPQPPKGGVNE